MSQQETRSNCSDRTWWANIYRHWIEKPSGISGVIGVIHQTEQTALSDRSEKGDTVQVIEYAAYQKLQAENERLKPQAGDNEKFLASDDCYYWTPEGAAKLTAAQKVVDAAREAGLHWPELGESLAAYDGKGE